MPLVNAAIATAGGTISKFFEYEGRRYSHVIDPATGRPVEHALASVTVVADTCMEADGWDTPLLVLGPERGWSARRRTASRRCSCRTADDGDGRRGADDDGVAEAVWMSQSSSAKLSHAKARSTKRNNVPLALAPLRESMLGYRELVVDGMLKSVFDAKDFGP